MEDIKISNSIIGKNHYPFLIAEMSGNHNQSLDLALSIVDEASNAGAHAIKLQTYTADTITINANHGEFLITDPSSIWYGKSLYELYQEAFTPWEWHRALFERARKKGLICFSTPFDESAVDFLETLNVPAYKIASFDNNHFPLLKKIAATGKPVIMSTGVSSICDLDNAITTLRQNGSTEIILLKCTSTYPSSPENSNLLTIPHMSELFQCHVGLSDHTLGIGVAIASIAFGARIIEKHFTLNRANGGVDSAFSIEPKEFRLLAEESKKAFESIGTISYGVINEEKNNLLFKRSIYIIKNLSEGSILSRDNIKIIRPGLGISPQYYGFVLGKRINKDVISGTALTFDLIN